MVKIFKNNLLMLKYVFKYCPNHFFLVNLSSFIGTTGNLISIFFTKYIIESITNEIEFVVILKTAAFIFLVNVLLSLINNYIDQYATPKNMLKLSKGMQNEVFNKCIEIDYNCYENPEFYNDFTMALQQTDNRALSVLSTVSMFVSSIFGITSFSIVISLYDPLLFILVFFNVFFNFIIMTTNTKIQHKFYEHKVLESRKLGYAQRVFYLSNFAKEIRLYKGIGKNIKCNFNDAINTLLHITKKYTKILFFRSSIQTIVSNIVHIIITLYIASKVLKKIISISDFVALTSSTSQLEMQINTFLQAFPSLYEHSLYIENFKKFMNYKSERLTVKAVSKNHLIEINNLSVENISFSYANKTKCSLENINFEAKIGDRIAFVGRNGSGKSTLIKLITRLYLPQTGAIKINNEDINYYNNESYIDNIAVLFQDYQVFSIPIIENILMRKIKNRVEDEQLVMAALRKVGLYEKVMSLPKNIYTHISSEYDENGTLLSGGELQRIAIARLFAKSSSLIILDEPSSSLDPISENEIFNDFLNTRNKKIIILATHRLANIINCDMIYFFDKGKIIEHGTHNELIIKNGDYAKMYKLQQHID